MSQGHKVAGYLFFVFLSIFFLSLPYSYCKPSSVVHMIQLSDDTINPVTAEYITKAIDRAYDEDAQCLIIKLDTPGGLLNSTRLIVKKMLMAKVPIVVYIAPGGSRAGSAGVFITYASHVAAMSPSTNIGAAHPVQMGEEQPRPSRETSEWEELRRLIEELKETKPEEKKEEPSVDDDPMSSKILNDTVAFIKAIAKERNRNVEWAVKSVTESDSITNDEALEMGVVEIVAKDDQDLLAQLNGRMVKIGEREVVLETADAQIVSTAMDPRQQFFNILANPNIAYLLMILGFYGLLYEITHPGFGVPGVLGVIFLILAFYSLQTLPTNYAGLGLMGLGAILLVSEIFVPGFGLLTLGGVVCLVLGSLLLFETADPIMRVSKTAIYTFSLTTAAMTFFLLRAVVKTHHSRVQSGAEGLIGQIGEAKSALGPGKKGKVFVHAELWNALSDEEIKKGEEVRIKELQGLTIKVERN